MLIQRGRVFTNYLNVQTCTVTLFNASSRHHTEKKYHSFTRRDSRCDAVASSSPLPPNLLEQGQGAGSGDKVAAKKRLAVFVSGGGSNFKAIHESIQNGTCNGDIVVVVTNAPACKAAEFAHDCGIPVLAYPPPSSKSSSSAPPGVVRSLDEASLTEELLNVRKHPK
jgi:hypothetical protein